MTSTPDPLHTHLAELQGLPAAERQDTADRVSALTRDVTSIIEAARLTSTDDDEYWCCEYCGEPIAYERLRARPAARTCVLCAAQDTKSRR
jgi:RNA polymerase-binding transcription factor DksA